MKISKVATLCSLFESLLLQDGLDLNMDTNRLHSLIATTFLFAYVWSIGGNLIEKCMDMFDSFVRELFAECHEVRVSKIIIGSMNKTFTRSSSKLIAQYRL